ncbi:unnamed protein product [Schistocephalus solidus]|uniref:tRNA-synt_His domain-containing protein n=1 Tax=Schistocephalus solidus TaxID=70667 RepID=A0A183TQX3_SCHSO|nr:unnamed protein product [Schistocephalus solidus]
MCYYAGDYDFDVRYQSTTNIGQADALSHLIISRTNEPEETVIMPVFVESEVHRLFMHSIPELLVTFEEVRNETQQGQL